MKKFRWKFSWMLSGAFFVLSLSWGGADSASPERLVTLLATNDIHGWAEPRPQSDGSSRGGLAWWGGVVRAIREGLKESRGDNAGVLLLDSGDQLQGTLISNHSEGKLIFNLLDKMGYDAVVPGNHDYDFGPEGWLDDKVVEGQTEDNPRGVIERLAKAASFPLLSANTYLKASLRENKGQVDWTRAERPDFLKPYLIKTIADVRVAMIGLDNVGTPKITVPENVSDLHFRDPVDTYLEIRKELSGKADAFVIMIHDGDAGKDRGATRMLQDVLARGKGKFNDGARVVDAVLAGHTHQVNDSVVEGVPLVQSGWGMDRFSRVDLFFEKRGNRVVFKKMKSYAGAALYFEACDKEVKAFCDTEKNLPRYERQKVVRDAVIAKEIDHAKAALAPLSKQVLGVAETDLEIERSKESSLGNILADELRELAGADVAFLNTGGIRSDLYKGEVLYEDLFRVFPFGNQGVKIGPMNLKKIMDLLERNIQSCGNRSILVESGLNIRYTANCSGRNAGHGDHSARFERIETFGGEILYDRQMGGPQIDRDRGFSVATLDFLLSGGSGYDGFKGIPVLENFGVLREALTAKFLKTPVRWSAEEQLSRWTHVPAQD